MKQPIRKVIYCGVRASGISARAARVPVRPLVQDYLPVLNGPPGTIERLLKVW
jgi:hypothetical protein